MTVNKMLDNKRLEVNAEPPYDALQAFVRENHIALKGSGTGELNGLTFAAKDVFKIRGSTFGNGHPDWLRTHEPDDFTSSTIQRLLDNGADLVGKTVCDELCFSISGENWNYGSPLNPHDPRRFTGGSSSGSGAATSGGLVDFALGSDCLGSVRVPASYTGVFGVRPTYDRVPSDGEAEYCPSMDVFGYMASDPEVFRKVSKVILGEDPEPVKLRKLIIAKDCFDAISPQVFADLKPAIDHIGANLSSVEEREISPDGLDNWIKVFQQVQGYEVWRSYGGWVRKYRPILSRGPRERLAWASTITLQEYNAGLVKMHEISRYVRDMLANGEVLVMPTAASVAPLRSAPLEEINATRLQSTYLLCVSPLSGVPQMTLPMVMADDLPLGLSLLSGFNTDLALANLSADLVKSYRASIK
ncbi:MAG TPA: amidase [Anaerolineaceae bacterium]|nr:amidase [Anaerolineaceae bacterium]